MLYYNYGYNCIRASYSTTYVYADRLLLKFGLGSELFICSKLFGSKIRIQVHGQRIRMWILKGNEKKGKYDLIFRRALLSVLPGGLYSVLYVSPGA